MTGTSPVLAILAFVLLAGCAGLSLLTVHLNQARRVDARLTAVGQQRTRAETDAPTDAKGQAEQLVAAIGAFVTATGLLSTATLEALRATLAAAGMRRENALLLFVGSKVILLATLPVATFLACRTLGVGPHFRFAILGSAVIVSLLLPDFIVRRVHSVRLRRVDRGIADALDLLTICAESGMGLEPAIARVVAEIRFAHPATAEEFSLTATELRIMPNAQIALTNLGTRTGLDALIRLGLALVQSLQYGTPLANSLRVLSNDLRQETLTRFEEQAARLPVMLTIPMVLCILPSLFLVIGGPAAVQVLSMLHQAR